MKFTSCISMIVVMGLAGCSSTLQGGLCESEANEIVLALAESGIASDKTAEKSDDGFAVRVSSSDLSQAYKVLRAAGLPRPRHAGFRAVYKERALVPGKTEEAALYQSALQEEIAATLESVERVVSARVHVTRKAESRFGRPAVSNPTASVLICYYPGPGDEMPISADEVKKIVAYSIDGLQADRVAVVFTPRRRVALPRENSGAACTSATRAPIVKQAAAGAAGLLFAVALGLFLLRGYRRRNSRTTGGGRS